MNDADPTWPESGENVCDETVTWTGDKMILEEALRKLSSAFDRFIGECMDSEGSPKQPARKALMRARAYLPPYCDHAYKNRTPILKEDIKWEQLVVPPVDAQFIQAGAGNAIKLSNLAGGTYSLDAVDLSTKEIPCDFGLPEDCAVCRFRLDGVVYIAIEDPEDGYRSYMSELVVDKSSAMKNVFPPIGVVARHRTESRIYSEMQKDNVLELVDVITGKTVLEVGTGNTDDYYPYAISRFIPEAMVTNQDNQ